MSKPRTWPCADCSSWGSQQELPPQCPLPGMGTVGSSILEDWLSSRELPGSESGDPNPKGGRAPSEEHSDTQSPPHPVSSSTWGCEFGGVRQHQPTSASHPHLGQVRQLRTPQGSVAAPGPPRHSEHSNQAPADPRAKAKEPP